MFLGSAGFIEIAARNASAAAVLNARTGQPLTLTAGPVYGKISSA
jgi:hypothetical protein